MQTVFYEGIRTRSFGSDDSPTKNRRRPEPSEILNNLIRGVKAPRFFAGEINEKISFCLGSICAPTLPVLVGLRSNSGFGSSLRNGNRHFTGIDTGRDG
jgi:hypothetical protein